MHLKSLVKNAEGIEVGGNVVSYQVRISQSHTHGKQSRQPDVAALGDTAREMLT
jgi:hypothetical protein